MSLAPVRGLSDFFKEDKQRLEENLDRLRSLVENLARFYCFGLIADFSESENESKSLPFRRVPVFSEEGSAYFHYLITMATSLSMRIRTTVLNLRNRMYTTVQVRMPHPPPAVQPVEAEAQQQETVEEKPGLLERVRSSLSGLFGGGESGQPEAELTAIITQTEGLIDRYNRLKIKAEMLGPRYAEWCREQLRAECTKVIPELYRRTHEYIRTRLAPLLNQEFAMTVRA